MNYGLGGYSGYGVETCYTDGFGITQCTIQPSVMPAPMMGPVVTTTPFWTTTLLGGWWFWIVTAIIVIIIIAIVLAVVLGKGSSSSSSSGDSIVPPFINSSLICNNVDTGLSLNPVETTIGGVTGFQIHLSTTPTILRSRFSWDGQSIYNNLGYLSRADDGHLYLNPTKDVNRLVKLVPSTRGYMILDQNGRFLTTVSYPGMVTVSQYHVKTIGIGTNNPITFVVVND